MLASDWMKLKKRKKFKTGSETYFLIKRFDSFRPHNRKDPQKLGLVLFALRKYTHPDLLWLSPNADHRAIQNLIGKKFKKNINERKKTEEI